MNAQDGDSRLALMQLHLTEGIGPRLGRRLLNLFGSPEAIFAARYSELRQVSGIGPRLAQSICTARDSTAAANELRCCQEHGIRLITDTDALYPASLRELPDAPLLLYCRGDLLDGDTLGIGIVGSRNCTSYGRQQAARLASGLAHAGMTVISGLARGIDAAAHQGALEAGGRTLAVLASDVIHVYPPEHQTLAAEIAEAGALLSETCLNQRPTAGVFPQRNRIISGLSLGVIIVEASLKSGALHTARHAGEQNREVLAVPGRVDSPTSAGCHALLRDGAILVRDVDDVLEALGPLASPVRERTTDRVVHTPRELQLSEQERAILDLITLDPVPIDTVLAAASLDASRVLATLTVLELRRLVQRLPGSFVRRRV